MIRVEPASLSDPQVRALIAFHQQDMNDISPPGTSYALDLSGLSGPDVTVVGAWHGERLVGIGALKRLGEGTAELKSMRTVPDFLGRGVARHLLAELVAIARRLGLKRLSLETGTSPDFAPAIALYTGNGFVAGDGFAGYANGPHNQCYHRDL